MKKFCNFCVAEFSVDDTSHWRISFRKDSPNPQYRCVERQRMYSKSQYETRKGSAALKKYQKESKLRAAYGIGVDEFEAMLTRQNGVCAICGGTNWGGNGSTPAVDHDHTTGKVRGLLCMHCNHALGKLNDNIDTLFTAQTYLLSNVDVLGKERLVA